MDTTRDTLDDNQATVFLRSAGRQALDGLGAGIGGILFLGMALLFGLGALGGDLLIRAFGLLGFGFFGLLMATGAIAGARRGGDLRVAEVGPDALWLPEMGRLRWDEIAEVRLERLRGAGGGRAPVTRQFRRLGVVPRDPERRAHAVTVLAGGLTSAYLSFVRAIAPEVRLGGDDAAPFGVSEGEIPDDFERLLEAVGRHAPILDAAEARARRLAPRWAVSDSDTAPRPVAPAVLPALDRALGAPTASSLADPSTLATEPLAPLVAVGQAGTPRGSFSVPPVRPLEVALGIVPLVAPLLIVVPLVLPTVLGGGDSGTFALLFLGFIVAVFVMPGSIQLVRLVRRLRERRSEQARLRVGPEGIWMHVGGEVAWDDVREMRTERAGWVRRPGSPQVERWRLVVRTAAGASVGVASDELDARFDDVLDLIRYYHPVVETS